MRFLSAQKLIVSIFALCFGFVGIVQAKPAQLSASEKDGLRQAAIAIIGPYTETAELGPPAVDDIGFGSAVAASRNGDDVWAVVGAPVENSQQGAVYVFKHAQGQSNWLELARITASDGAASDQFGSAVAIDGDTIAIGAPGHKTGSANGGAYVFVLVDDQWMQQGSTFVGANNFGASVVVSADTLVIGAPHFNSGSAAVYLRSGDSWSFSQSLTPPDSPIAALFASSVSMDGQSLLIGAPGDSSIAHQVNRGSAYMFALDRTKMAWTFQQKLIAGLDGEANDRFGSSVSVQGNSAVVGVPGRNGNQGAVNSFRFSGGTWVLQPTLQAADGSSNDGFGSAVALENGVTSENGALVVGAPSKYDSDGYLYNYSGDPSAWSQSPLGPFGNFTEDELGTAVASTPGWMFAGAPQTFVSPGYVEAISSQSSGWGSPEKLQAFDSHEDAFGKAVAISGNRAIVSAPEGSGAATIYEREANGKWTLETAFEIASVTSVAIDGDTAVIGQAPDGTRDIVSIYVRTPTGWTKQKDLSDPDGKSNDQFGFSISISGSTIAVGAPGVNSYAGAGYIFVRSGTDWVLQKQLIAPDSAPAEWFGTSAAIDGNSAVFGAPFHDSAAGAAYLFTRTGTTWSAREEFNGNTSDNFGSAVAISGNTIAIGSPEHSGAAGEVYIYTGSGSSWSLQKALTAPTPITNGWFGTSVGLAGDRVVIGEPGNTAAHVFTRTGTTWKLRTQLGNSSGSDFGYAVSLSGTNALVGAFQDQLSGRAYIFDDSDEIFANGFN